MREEMHEAMERDRKARELPSVAGTMERSIADHIRGCLVLIDAEQSKIAPDNHIIATLADSVRMGREYAKSMVGRITAADLAELIGAAEAVNADAPCLCHAGEACASCRLRTALAPFRPKENR